jgi:hypothetical protein
MRASFGRQAAGRMKASEPGGTSGRPQQRERDHVPQGTVEATALRAEGPLCGADAAAEPADAEPPSRRPGTRPGDHPQRRR